MSFVWFNRFYAVVAYAAFFSGLRMLVGATSVLFLTSKGLNLLDIGCLKAFQAGIILSVDTPLAYWADRKSRRGAVCMACMCTAVWLFITASGQTLGHFYLAEAFNGLGLALFNGAFTAILVQAAKDQSISIQKAFADESQYSHLMMACCAILGTYWVQPQQPIMWWVAGIALSFQACITFICLPKNYTVAADQTTWVQDWLGFFKLYQNQPIFKQAFLHLLWISVAFEICVQFWQPLLAPALNRLDDGARPYGILFVLILIIQSFGAYILNVLPKHSSFSFVLWICCILGIILAQKMNYLFALIGFVLLAFMSLRMLLIQQSSNLHEHIDDRWRATYDAMGGVFIRICSAASLPFMGMVFEALI